jgi:hypothetical protein
VAAATRLKIFQVLDAGARRHEFRAACAVPMGLSTQLGRTSHVPAPRKRGDRAHSIGFKVGA